ncbi:DUF4176 domain-containing protein [Ruminococcus bicirculans (ex Wegman et al. 2014)]|uniref:DUF4176 domain-containing protein n=1 Tax=Ruminococcus bicirculans (ex Wegman et al. 2014) TaxID=1160721 RepID=UPI00307C2281
MLTGLLPIGTVVLLKESTKRLMIIGVLQKQLDNGRMWDYVGVLYPEGFVGSDQTYLFDNDMIDKIFALGYQDLEQFDFKEDIDKQYAQIMAEAIKNRDSSVAE